MELIYHMQAIGPMWGEVGEEKWRYSSICGTRLKVE